MPLPEFMMQKSIVLKLLCGLGLFTVLGTVYLSSRKPDPERSNIPKPESVAIKRVAIKGKEVEGAILTASTDSSGELLKLKIQQVELDPEDPEQDVYLYTVLTQNPANQQWQNICQPDKNNVAKAIPLSGFWDRTGKHVENGTITFACTSGVAAKCVRWGYKPWKTMQGVSLQALHQACTRMAQADYCGNGIAHTKEGTPIDMYDLLSIQKRSEDSGMMFEAAWTPDGAAVIDRTRYPDALAQVRRDCPERLVSSSEEVTPVSLQKHHPEVLIFNDSFVR